MQNRAAFLASLFLLALPAYAVDNNAANHESQFTGDSDVSSVDAQAEDQPGFFQRTGKELDKAGRIVVKDVKKGAKKVGNGLKQGAQYVETKVTCAVNDPLMAQSLVIAKTDDGMVNVEYCTAHYDHGAAPSSPRAGDTPGKRVEKCEELHNGGFRPEELHSCLTRVGGNRVEAMAIERDLTSFEKCNRTAQHFKVAGKLNNFRSYLGACQGLVMKDVEKKSQAAQKARAKKKKRPAPQVMPEDNAPTPSERPAADVEPNLPEKAPAPPMEPSKEEVNGTL